MRLEAVQTGLSHSDATEADKVFQEALARYQRMCETFVAGVVASIHLILGAVPPSHVSMEEVGDPLVACLLNEVSLRLRDPPAMEPWVETEIRAALCPVDEGHVESLREEWVRMLGVALASPSSA